MPPFIEHLNLEFGSEVIYSFVIIVCSLMIYFGTKELYELSSYKGIKYFRGAFLFFALAYFFRSFIMFILAYFNIIDFFNFSPIFSPIMLFIFMYFSSMAIFYLLYSIMWKKWNGSSNKIYLFHILAIIISIINILSRSPIIYFGINILLLIFVILISYTTHKGIKNKTKGINLYIIYMLLFIFWTFNIVSTLIPKFLQFFQLFIYIISLGIFLVILYKVLRKTGD